MRKILLSAAAGLMLTGCVSGGAGVYAGSVEIVPFCENYAEQTYRNVLQDLYDPADSFAVDVSNERRARRVADRAYERCQQGRTN